MANALSTQATVLAVIIISCCDVIMCQNDAHCNDAGQPVKCYFSDCIHGICVNVTYQFDGGTLSLEECKCDTGWTGFYCDTCCKCDPDEICVSSPFPLPPKCIRNDTSSETTTTLTYTNEVRDQSPIDTTTSQCTYPARNSTPCYVKHVGIRCVNGICEETYCDCDKGWGGFECEVCCDLPCDHGRCDATIVGGPKCACETGYQGDLCDKIKPKEVVPIGIWFWCLVGVACAALLASVIVIAVLWKQRNIIILKIVCKIQMMKYDRNIEKDKKYDVCISCAGRDERFVETWILPQLERELGYKVWMKARDAMPGDVISSSVIASVKQSRRTLMVISPDYLTEEWPLFEVQQALVETLQQNHAIIPIIISDMSHVDYIQPLIRSIMQTWRCVKWPADVESEKKIKRFWKRVEVSMPDRPTTKDDEVDTEEFVDSEVKKQFACDDIKGHDNFVFIHDQDALYMNAEDSKTSL